MNRFVFIFLCLGWLVAMAAMVVLGHLSHHLIAFSLLYCLAFILLFAIVSKFPQYLNRYNAFLLILLLGFTGRALFLFYPIGNDVYRYVWEGYIQTRGFNPFSHAPIDPALTEVAQGDLHSIWQNINHKEFSAAYPALTLLMFRFLAWLNPDPIFFKIAMVLIDIGVMIVLAQIINIRQLPSQRLLLYACNPLVIVFVAGEGHMDVIQVLFLFLGVFLLLSQKEISGFVSLGLAAVSKYFAGIAVPFFITAESRKTWAFVFRFSL